MKTIKITIVISLFLLLTQVYAAVEDKWKITGKIIEETTGTELPYVTIALNNLADSSLITGTISNEDGGFVLEKIKKGDYYLTISFMGYKTQIVDHIDFSKNEQQVDIGDVHLSPSSELLSEVEISAKVSPLSQSMDKQTIQVSKNISTIGGTAVDAVKLSPSVSVNGDGEVLMRGSAQFLVLINGKPTTLSPSDVLKQTPSNIIDRIEIMTNPSVKYSASGGAGMINIILKSGIKRGFNGMVNATIGSKGKYSSDASFNLNMEKYSLSVGADWRDWNTTALNDYYRDLYHGDTTHFATMFQDRLINDNNLGIRLGFELHSDEKNTLSYSFHGGYNTTTADINVKNHGEQFPMGDEKYAFNTYDMKQKPTFYTNNLNYTHLFNKEGQSLSINGYYSYIDYYLRTYQEQTETDATYEPIDPRPYYQDILNDNYSHDVRFDLDYTHPFSEKTNLETGVSAHHYYRFLDVTYAYFDHDTNSWVNHPDYTNKYHFNESVYASYANLNTSLYGIITTLGLRVEYMDRLMYEDSRTEEYPYDKVHFFPAVSFAKSFNDKHRLSLANSSRINRPDEYMMNPFPEFEDDYFYAEGNPFLLPEIVRNYELSYQYAGKRNMYSSNLFYRTTTDKIEQRLWIEDDEKIHTSFHNDCSDQSLGLELMTNMDLTKWWSLNASGSLYHYTIEGKVFEDPFSNSQFSWNAQIINSFSFWKNTSLQIVAFYNSQTARSQGSLSDYYFVDASLKKDFLDNKLSISVQCKDIFQSLNYQLITETADMDLLGDFNNESPIFLFSVGFQISQFKKKTKDVETEFDM